MGNANNGHEVLLLHLVLITKFPNISTEEAQI